MLRIAVTGAAGKMGKMNIRVISQDKDSKVSGAVAGITGAVEMPGSPFIGIDAGEVAGIGRIGVPISDDIRKVIKDCDAVIDFSSLSAFETNIREAVSEGKAIVLGTTGVGDKELLLVKEAGKKIPIIWAPNFSVGVTLIAKLTRLAAEVLNQGFDPEIVEVHHRLKKDSPSGTAVKLLNVLKDVYHTENVVYGREGMVGERPDKQIGVSAVRGGDVVGEHTVSFYGIGERVEIVHKASTRETFAFGALRAAKYIIKKGKGVYTMEDVLGL